MRGSEFVELSAFAAIVQHGSFVRAASHLRVSPSALSQTIRSLEERLGVRLLNRTTRSVGLSEAGARLLTRLSPALGELDAAVADVRALRDEVGGVVRINTARIPALAYIAPLLGRFHAAHPKIKLEVMIDDALTDIIASRCDAGIRLGERVEKDLVALKLSGELEMFAVASPEYLARRGVPKTPHDLHEHDCINWRLPSGGNLYRWEFERGRRALDVAVEGPLVVNDAELALRAAAEGVGIAYLVDLDVEKWIARKQLVRVLADWSPSFPGFYLYYPNRRQVPAPLRTFVDFIRAEVPSPRPRIPATGTSGSAQLKEDDGLRPSPSRRPRRA
ncbi:MAG: transcriptional regulator [Labilithrix sp.]|nr:transcriptional regulator [Labilithrix sp.]